MAYVAEKDNRTKITGEDVEKGYEEVKEIKRKYYLEGLPHHKLICEIVKKNPGITSSDFYEVYKQEAKEHGLNLKSERTLSNYVNSLLRLGYLKIERVKARGNVRLFTVA